MNNLLDLNLRYKPKRYDNTLLIYLKEPTVFLIINACFLIKVSTLTLQLTVIILSQI